MSKCRLCGVMVKTLTKYKTCGECEVPANGLFNPATGKRITQKLREIKGEAQYKNTSIQKGYKYTGPEIKQPANLEINIM